MIRYVAEFRADLTQSAFHDIREMLKAAADSRAMEDVVIANGGTLKRLDRPEDHKRAAFLRRARSRVR